MRIGLVTYYYDVNCGTCLQAYATLKALKKVYKDDEVFIIPFYVIKPHFRPYIHNLTLLSLIRDFRRLNMYKDFIKNNLGVISSRIITDTNEGIEYIKSLSLDKIYVGADTLLELGRTKKPDYDGLSVYWLSSEVTSKKYMLASSCGAEEYSMLSMKQKREMKDSLNDFLGYGVRDINTLNLFKHFVPENKIILVPDPTFVLNIDYNIVTSYLKMKNIRISTNAVLFHVNRLDTWAKEVAIELKKRGYMVYSLRPAKWADRSLNDMGPLEQIGIYKYFRLVITHRFHDSIFCLKNGTPMLLYIPDSGHSSSIGESKFSTLIKQFGLYPDNIVEDKKITANLILNKVEKAISNFNSHKEEIVRYIKIQESKYWDYLNSTVV